MSADPPAPPTEPDREWFRSLFHGNFRPLLAYARRRVDPATADDVVAETLLVAWRRRDAAPSGHERPWLYGIARNVIRNSARSARRQQAFRETLRGLPQPKPYDPPAVDEQAEVMRHCPLQPVRGRPGRSSCWSPGRNCPTPTSDGCSTFRPTRWRSGFTGPRKRLAEQVEELLKTDVREKGNNNQ